MANRMLILHKGKKVVEGLVSELLDPSCSVVHVETDNDEAIRTKLLQTKWSRFLQPGGNGIQLAMSKHEVPALVSDPWVWGAGIRRIRRICSKIIFVTYNPTRPCGRCCKLNL